MSSLRILRSGKIATVDDGEAVEIDRADPLALLPFLGMRLELEPGLTFGELLRALSPYEASVSAIGHLDLAAWQQKTFREYDGPFADFERIMLKPMIAIRRDGSRSKAKPITLGISWYDMTEPGSASLTYADPASYAHVPIVIDCRAVVEDPAAETWRRNAVSPAIQESDPASHDGIEIVPTLVDAVIRGLLDHGLFLEKPFVASNEDNGGAAP